MPPIPFDRIPYAGTDELPRYGLPEEMLRGVNEEIAHGFLCSASDMVDSAAGDHYEIPLTNWSGDVRMYVCWIAAYLVAAHHGYNPEGSDQLFYQRYTDALAWLEKLATGSRRIPGGTTRGPAGIGGPIVISRPLRGF